MALSALTQVKTRQFFLQVAICKLKLRTKQSGSSSSGESTGVPFVNICSVQKTEKDEAIYVKV